MEKTRKNTFKKWLIRLTATGILSLAILLGIIFNPAMLYAAQTQMGKHMIYHQQALAEDVKLRIAEALKDLESSELYTEDIALNFCLNDGSSYPALIEALRGPAFAWGFYNKVVLNGQADYQANTLSLHGYDWNLTQLLTHEATHCLQFWQLGFWQSNPVGKHPHWKWEGYPEYVARRAAGQVDLIDNIQRQRAQQEEKAEAWAYHFEDGTIAPRHYYEDWLLIQYCLDVKGMSYRDVLADRRLEKGQLQKEMMVWFDQQQE